jgi:tetratricopeptide (TPR) repeat protein
MKATATLKVKLAVTAEVVQSLQETNAAYVVALNSTSQVAFEQKVFNSVALHHVTYRDVKAATRLPANLVCAARCVQALEGKYDEGIRLMRQVQQLDPLSLVINTDVGYVYYIARRYDEAIALYRSALTMDAKFSLAHLLLGLALTQKGQHAEAIAEVQLATDRGSEYLAALGNVYARAGRRTEALATLEKLQELARHQYVPPYQFAWIYCGLDDRDQAVASLQKSAQEKAGVIDFKHHPVYEPLRGDARYEELLRHAPYHW